MFQSKSAVQNGSHKDLKTRVSIVFRFLAVLSYTAAIWYIIMLSNVPIYLRVLCTIGFMLKGRSVIRHRIEIAWRHLNSIQLK